MPRLGPSSADITRDWLIAHADMKLADAAKLVGISGNCLGDWYKKLGVSRQRSGPPSPFAHITREWCLERRHVPAAEVAAELGCGPKSVHKLMGRHGVDYHPLRKAAVANHDCDKCKEIGRCQNVRGALPCEVAVLEFERELERYEPLDLRELV